MPLGSFTCHDFFGRSGKDAAMIVKSRNHSQVGDLMNATVSSCQDACFDSI